MKVPKPLADAFGAPFQDAVIATLVKEKLLSGAEELESPRFLARSVIPHVQRLSELFNRKDSEAEPVSRDAGLDPYWTTGSNPKNLRLSYFLSFMPPNLFRVASVWAELSRLGYRWPEGLPFRAIEWGAGPATGACGVSAGEHHAPIGLPRNGSWALIDQDRPMLQLGEKWAQKYFSSHEHAWETRLFHRKLDFTQPMLPRNAPKFGLWLMSYFLNEATPGQLTGAAERFVAEWDRHVEDEGLIVIVEPALKAQSRKLLELRRQLLELRERGKGLSYQVLLPCLGHQACGALSAPEDWCHEETVWWRPPYLRRIDQMAGLDRKSLAFSYLVIAKSKRPMSELLPATRGFQRFERLVSPSHSEGKDLEFYLCGKEGKRRARYRPGSDEDRIGRGDIIADGQVRGDRLHSRVESFQTLL